MDFGARRTYQVADSRLPMYCTYSGPPPQTVGSRYGQPIQYSAPLPGNLGTGSSNTLYNSSAIPQSRMIQCTSDPFIANQRLMVIPPRMRRIYAGIDLDEEDDDPKDAYTAPAFANRPQTQRVENYIDEIVNSPQMEEIENETRKIRRDAQAVLQKLGESSKRKPTKLTSVYFPEHTYTPSPNASNTGIYRTTYSPPKRTYISEPSYHRTEPEAEKETDLDVDDYYTYRIRPRRPIQLVTPRFQPLTHDPSAEAQMEINRRTLYEDNARKLNDSFRPYAASRRNEAKIYSPDIDEVKNRINVRAQSKALRDSANIGLRKPNDYLML